jgi:uncharacterized protein
VILLDTTVLAYASGSEHPLRQRCRRIIEAHQAGRILVTTTVEVLQEFLHTAARRRTRVDAVELVRTLATGFELEVTLPTDLERAFGLFPRHPRLGAFDAVLAAVALERRAEALVSADHAFGGVVGLRWIDPATPDLDALLAPS